jgi:GTP-binding protein LepA
LDFFDELKSRTKGYASLDYQFLEYRVDELQKLEILVNGEPLDALAAIVHEKDAFYKGQRLITKLKDLIPASCTMWRSKPLRADESFHARMSKPRAKTCWQNATAAISRVRKNCSRNRKRGKKRLKMVGNVEIRRRLHGGVEIG